MKRELYENYLLAKYIMMSMEQINKLEPHEKSYYVGEVEKYLKNI